MSKYGWLFLTTTIVIVITLVANQIQGLTLASELNQLPNDIGFNVSSITGFFNTYFGLLTFNVNGVPSIVSLFFIPLNLVMGFILIEMVIKAFDAVIPG